MLDTIFQYGEDALDNEAVVNILLPNFLILEDFTEKLSFRAIEFSAPEYNIRTLTQKYRGYEISRWIPGTETARETTVKFRIDKYWSVYDTLLTWAKQISNLEEGTFAKDVLPSSSEESFGEVIGRGLLEGFGIGSNSLRATMTIQQENVAGDILGNGWKFEGVWPKSISEVSFNNAGDGTPMDVSVVFSYLTCKRQ